MDIRELILMSFHWIHDNLYEKSEVSWCATYATIFYVYDFLLIIVIPALLFYYREQPQPKTTNVFVLKKVPLARCSSEILIPVHVREAEALKRQMEQERRNRQLTDEELNSF